MDSLDLTFVRCPSCRSLVPAISTRCRMCGASLEASSESLAGNVEKSSTAASSGSVSSGSSEGMLARSETSKTDSERSGVIKFDDGKRTPDQAGTTGEDPLSAYVEDSYAEEAPSSPSLTATKDAASVGESATAAATGDPLSESAIADKSMSASNLSGNSSAELKRNSGTRPDNSKLDSSRAGSNEKPGGDPSVGNRQPFEARKNTQERRYQQPVATSSAQPGRDQNNNRRVDMKGSESRGGEMRGSESGRGVENRGPVSSGNAALARTPAVVPATGIATSNRARETQVFGSGRLVGWLVSYADTRGASLELREGKFFVTAKSIKENDLVLEDRSVSTPHALVGCGRDGTLTIQDLMSDRGVFVRRRGSNQYRQEEEAIPVEHGDWLRFGDLEFLVVLIPAGME